MAEKIINSFDVWITAKGLKSQLRLRTVDNVSLEGIHRLRDLILELAIQGKLTSRDSKDEPAEALLTKIRQEKKGLIEKGIIKKERSFAEISDKEKPFDLPPGWEWTRIESIGHDWGQKEPKNDFSYIEVSGIDSDKGVIKSTTILAAKDAPSRARKIVKKGTVIYSTVRPYLKNICLVDTDYSPEPIASTAFAVIHPFQSMPGKYFFYYFRSPTFVRYVESVQIGVAYPAINDSQFFGGLVAVPPLAEQHRIVAKVDELMALCDELEKQETQHLKSHQLLVETMLGTLAKANDATEFQTAWSRLAQHFNDIFTTEDSIDQLKQTILQLAVMGKLVPQDPNDEPAGELLKKIEKEKERLYTEGENAKSKVLPRLQFEEEPFEIPKTWSWTRLGNTGIGSTGKTPPTSNSEYFAGDIPFIGPGQIIESGEILSAEKFLSERGRLQSETAKPGDILMVCIGGSIGKSAIAKSIITFNQQINCIRPLFIKSEYLNFTMNAEFFNQRLLEKATGSATPIINRGKWEELPIPLAPLAEQERIVAKVEELFLLCDRLKEGILGASRIANILANSAIHEIAKKEMVIADEV